MSGVSHGSRLEQLYALRERLDLEIEVEQRLANLRPRPLAPREKPVQLLDPPTLEALGASHRDVKEWGVRVGLLETFRRGPAPAHLIRRYLEAHA